MFLRNVGLSPNYTALQFRRTFFSTVAETDVVKHVIVYENQERDGNPDSILFIYDPYNLSP
jgi:hypothetical protein